MSGFSLVEFSIRRPKLVVWATVALTLLFGTQFPKIRTDTNPKNMLPETSDVRVWNDSVDKTFALYEDTIVVGIENEAGVLNRETLGRIARITDAILALPGVASRDVNGFTTITNVTAEAGTLKVGPLMPGAPKTDAEVEDLRRALSSNALLMDRVISKDGRTTAIYVPLEKGAKGTNGAEIAQKLREIVAKETGAERYYVAGDPVARDTFGAEMFKLMGIFSPIAGAIMFAAIQLMFRNLSLSFAMMGVAMAAIIWSIGLLIGAGFPVHIMSSMAPVFLMAIATDSIHIFNEFYFRYREKHDKLTAIRETMAAVSRPVRFTALATATGFAVLLFMNIVPVQVFGGLIAFGTVILRLFSFSLIPAILTFVKEDKLAGAAAHESVELDRTARMLRGIGSIGATRPLATVLVGLTLVAAAIVGTTKIHVNNNLVAWFKDGSEIRVADTAMNKALGGTSLGYLVVKLPKADDIKRPETLRWIEGLQRHLEEMPVVGKTFSVADTVKRINRVLHDDDAKFDAVPETQDTVGQYLFLFSMSAKPSDLDNVVDASFQQAAVWVQMKTWDAEAMRQVIDAAKSYQRSYPVAVEVKPAGIAYFNLVWNDEVLGDLVLGLTLALVVVFVILALDFRSARWALVAYVPLVFTILLIYGVVGFTGKDFDMPLSVMSTLSLGMAVDFAIHFVSRFRQHLAETGGRTDEDIRAALLWTAARPGKGIFRNAVLFAAAFSVMLFAPLTPYMAVGAFIVAMMMISALLTILYLPALVMLGRRWLIPNKGD
ncbi:MAG: MMPL family transporter [Candidatus Nitricoxidivorans perseverans]|uniref:MMPL family transporter n=1 Tax=Candidatus Nitricoxidivorans perseverans TaxID=2975601 RepID=A0AA49IYX8_9PROT|nr:MAG: MMPL family transporter [Candidatus Nitricoxidivorans perseverans]